jgi:hypothetical protein
MGMIKQAKALVRRQLARAGYRLVKVNVETEAELARLKAASYDASRALPPGADTELRADNPRLRSLRDAYERCDLPMRAHSLWNPARMHRQLEMKYFRGDNVYVWQLRNVREHARLKYFLYAQYVQALDHRGLLRTLTEDGQFGCWTFEYAGFPVLSRDLLDSVNELYFLDRHLQLFDRTDFNVLDIGAGYGRLAHRMTTAVPGLSTYYCTDAVAESTFLCEYYLRYRGCEKKTQVVPLDAVDATLPSLKLTLAMNIHSFSEMRYDAIAGWFERLGRLRIPYLMIVPNDPLEFLSREPDGSQRDFSGLIRDAGYRQIACEPALNDANIRALVGVEDHMFLFEAT